MSETWTTKDIPPQDGKRIIVTGANSGIGWNTALELARAGAEVTIASRRKDSVLDAADRIRAVVPSAMLKTAVVDLSDPESVERFADEELSDKRAIDILVNNAGVMALPKRQTSPDGHELQFATNVLGPFRLTGRLLPAILRARSPRVVTVSSYAHTQGGPVPIQDLDSLVSYRPIRAYSKTKLENVLFTRELQRRYAGRLLATCCHPGATHSNLWKSSSFAMRLITVLMQPMIQSSAQGAEPTLMAATYTQAKPGAYYGPGGMCQLRGHPIEAKTAPFADDIDAASDLFRRLEEISGVHYPR